MITAAQPTVVLRDAAIEVAARLAFQRDGMFRYKPWEGVSDLVRARYRRLVRGPIFELAAAGKLPQQWRVSMFFDCQLVRRYSADAQAADRFATAVNTSPSPHTHVEIDDEPSDGLPPLPCEELWTI